jgi:hypothetical protein
MRIILLVVIHYLTTLCSAYRFAWRPDTKVFPYEDVPPASQIDNGDNNGITFQDQIRRTKVKSIVQKCIDAWAGDGKCNIDNNKPECKFDRGDCCANSCKVNCQEVDKEGNDLRHITWNITLTPTRPCSFDCGVLGYDCLSEN